MASDRFEIFPHTADKGIRAFGRDLKELFENAAYGMFSLMADLGNYAPTLSREVEAHAPDLESLLRTWLAELLYQFEVDRILFVDFEVKAVEDRRVEGVARGLPFDHDIEWLGSPVKAVTHHNLYAHRTDDRWEAQIIFDV
ncbi:MAG TPA: archease [Armatimonadota bacterium]|nr:archease [Armatimonadota bacterium]